MAKPHLGLDIGTGALKMALCDENGVRRLAVENLPENLVKAGEIVSYEAMADFIKESLRKHRIAARGCAMILPTGLAFLRRLTMPVMDVEQLRFNLPYEFRDYVTAGKDQYFYDYAVNEIRQGDEEGGTGTMDLLAAAVGKQTVADYRNMCRRAGLRLRVAAPVECAYGNLIRVYGQEKPELAGQEYCVLDMGHAATRLHIYTGSRFEATRVVEIGGATVDSAIASAMSVDEHIARTYKEANHQGAQELDAPRSVYTNIAIEVMKAVNFYGFNNRESDLQHIYYCGGGAKLELLRQAIADAGELRRQTQTTGLTLHTIEELLPPMDHDDQADASLCAAAVGITMQ